MAEFHRVLPENVRFLPKTFTDFLQLAVDKSPTSDLSVEDAIAYAEVGAGDIIAVTEGGKPIGCAFFMYGKSKDGPILDVALLGGKGVIKRKEQFKEYTINKAKSIGCAAIWVMGREGWKDIFPDLKQIGVIYALDLR